MSFARSSELFTSRRPALFQRFLRLLPRPTRRPAPSFPLSAEPNRFVSPMPILFLISPRPLRQKQPSSEEYQRDRKQFPKQQNHFHSARFRRGSPALVR